MPCFHPLLGLIDLERSRELHRVFYRFIGADSNPDLYKEMLKEKKSLSVYRDPAGVVHRDILVPCRQCVGCRLEYSRQWANRLMLELGCHDQKTCFFITLTYEEEKIPRNSVGYMTLRPEDMTDFIKRLREHQARELGSDLLLRYYYSGEYGDTTFHPHYHMIAFSLNLPDLKLLKKTPNGPLFTSDYLDKIWSHGFCFIAEVSWEDCAYTARYMMKKLKGERAQEYEAFDVKPEFSRMSRRPGIGSQVFSIKNFEKGILKYVNGRPVTVPDSWRRLIRGYDMESLARVKDSRSLLVRLRELQANGSDYKPSDSLKIKEIETLSSQKFHTY